VYRIFIWTFWLGLAGAVAGVVAIFFVVAHYEARLPSVEQLQKNYRPPQVTRILARDGAVLAEVFTERRTVVPFASIPGHSKLAFLAAEDAHFYEHEGLNYLGMLRAMLVNLRAGRTVQGGSTITQQVVKNVLLVSERTYARKIQETILARRLEQTLSKDQILGLYLNHIYLGHGRYGIEEAARVYFGKHASELGLAESAMLAGIVASPERFSPRKDSVKALERRRFVLKQMGEKGFVSPEAVEQALNEPLRLAPLAEDESDLAPEAVAQAKQLLEHLVGEQARRGGYTVTTTIDSTLQAAARQAVRDNLQEYGKRYKLEAPLGPKSGWIWGPVAANVPRRYHAAVGRVLATDDDAWTLEVQIGNLVGTVKLPRAGFLNPKNLPPSKFAPTGAKVRVVLDGDPDAPKPELHMDLLPQSALVSIDVRSRHVLAIVGSREALNGGLDRATQMRRQPGSSFKPFVYSYALTSRKFTAASIFTVPPKKGETEPLKLTMRDGLARSENAVAQQLLEAVGPVNVVSWAKTMGIDSPLAPTASLALGAYEVSPIEITNAYATFASGGVAASPILVTRIVGPDGKEIFVPRAKEPRNVMAAEEAYLITSLMRSVVEKGTAQRAKRLGRPVVGKTGTTNQAKDTWFVGYSPEIVTGVWVGFDDPVGLGDAETGGGTALPAWVAFMKVALAGRPVVGFPRPAGIEVARIDPGSGLLALDEQADGIDEDFLAGTAPQERVSPDAGTLVGADAGITSPGPVEPLDTKPSTEVPKTDPGSLEVPGETAKEAEPPAAKEAAPSEPMPASPGVND
jgi:penicillin-binding protein 1A